MEHFTVAFFRDVTRQIIDRFEPTYLYYWLVEQYNSPGRYYHNCRHIDFCLAAYQALPAQYRQSPHLAWSIMLHDVVNDPHKADNEQQSARISSEYLKAIEPDERFADTIRWPLGPFTHTVAEMIQATTHKSTNIQSKKTQLLLDIDLLGLSKPFGEFWLDGMKIRMEYDFVSDELFIEKRIEIFEGFLERPKIYLHPHFQCHEEQARENLKRAIAKLRGSNYQPG